jgi:hypothetical protein
MQLAVGKVSSMLSNPHTIASADSFDTLRMRATQDISAQSLTSLVNNLTWEPSIDSGFALSTIISQLRSS